MFEGLFSPSHLLILALVVLIFVGPRKLANQWRAVGRRFEELTDGEPNTSEAAPVMPTEDSHLDRRPTRAYRFGQRIRRRR